MSATTLAMQAQMILGGRDELLVELRAVHPRLKPAQVRCDWFGVEHLDGLERRAEVLATSYDVWVGAAPRLRRGGKRADVAPSVTAWCDCDSAEACDALRAFTPRPTLVVRTSARTGEHLQGWWRLDRPLAVDQLEAVNRRLAAALGSDRSVVDAPRVLRALGTRNLKRSVPEPVEAVDMTGEVHDVDALLRALPDDVAHTGAHPRWQMPDGAMVPVGERYATARGLIGLLSGRGVPPHVLQPMIEAFLEHGCAQDPATPIELEPVRALVQTFARADRAAVQRLRDGWWARTPGETVDG